MIDTTIINEINKELIRAKVKHPNFPDDVIHMVAIMAEESGEAIQAAVQNKYEGGTLEHVKTELIHTIATAIRCLENMK